MGTVAVEMVIDLVQGQHLDGFLYTMPTELVIRDSCRAVEASA